MLRELPEFDLTGKCLGVDFFGGFAVYDNAPLPLRLGDIPYPNASFRRNRLLNSTNMGLHPRVCDHCSSINTILNHTKTIFNQELPKDGILFSFLLLLSRQVEGDDHPAHFKFGGVQGLYSLTDCLSTAFRKLRTTLSMQLLIVISILK